MCVKALSSLYTTNIVGFFFFSLNQYGDTVFALHTLSHLIFTILLDLLSTPAADKLKNKATRKFSQVSSLMAHRWCAQVGVQGMYVQSLSSQPSEAVHKG